MERSLKDIVNSTLGLYPETKVSNNKLIARIWQSQFGIDYNKALAIMEEACPQTIVRTKNQLEKQARDFQEA